MNINYTTEKIKGGMVALAPSLNLSMLNIWIWSPAKQARNLLKFYILLGQKAQIIIGCVLQSNYGYASLLESWK
jgi:hypothetical protein